MRKPFKPSGWRNLKIIAGIIDFIQIIVDFIPGAGELANEIIDIAIGIILGIIYWWKRVITMSAFIALVFSFFGEEVTAAAAPLWVLDVWYTQRTGPPSNEEATAAAVGSYVIQNRNSIGDENEPVSQGNTRLPDNARQKPLNIRENGVNVRPPSINE